MGTNAEHRYAVEAGLLAGEDNNTLNARTRDPVGIATAAAIAGLLVGTLIS